MVAAAQKRTTQPFFCSNRPRILMEFFGLTRFGLTRRIQINPEGLTLPLLRPYFITQSSSPKESSGLLPPFCFFLFGCPSRSVPSPAPAPSLSAATVLPPTGIDPSTPTPPPISSARDTGRAELPFPPHDPNSPGMPLLLTFGVTPLVLFPRPAPRPPLPVSFWPLLPLPVPLAWVERWPGFESRSRARSREDSTAAKIIACDEEQSGYYRVIP